MLYSERRQSVLIEPTLPDSREGKPISQSAIIGVDLGGTNVRVGKVLGQSLESHHSQWISAHESQDHVLEEIYQAVEQVLDDDVIGIGCGVPSVVDVDRGIVYAVENIPSWHKVHLKDQLETRFGIPAYINNDANAFALGVLHFGEGAGYRNLVGLTLGTGLGAGIILDSLAGMVPQSLPWVSLYWVFAAVALLMIVVIGAVKLPEVELKEDERAGAWETHTELLKNPFVLLYFFGIFCYVGAEQGVANWISKFLATYHGFDPQIEGAHAVAYFWGLLTAGCLLGLLLLKLFDCRKVLIGFSAAAIVSLTLALFGSAQVSYYSFMMVGFFLSVMWSVIFSLALNSVAQHHGSFSGILCTGIVGGAFVSLAVGWLGDQFGLRFGMMLLYLALGYILAIGFWARPLIDNATVTPKELLLALPRWLETRREARD